MSEGPLSVGGILSSSAKAGIPERIAVEFHSRLGAVTLPLSTSPRWDFPYYFQGVIATLRANLAASGTVVSKARHTRLTQSRPVPMMGAKTKEVFHGSAGGRRYQDPRGAGLEGRPRAALHGVVVLAEAAHLPQPQGHSVAVASDRPARLRKHAGVVSRHQSAGASAGAGARRCRAHREQRHHPVSGTDIPGAAADSGRPRERGSGTAAARGRPASRSAHAELSLRLCAARPTEACGRA